SSLSEKIKSQPNPFSEAALRGRLQRQLDAGEVLLKRLPANSFAMGITWATRPEDIREWVTKVELLLKDHPRLLSRFRYKPPEPPLLTTMLAFSGQRRRMEQYMEQLESIIRELD